MKWDTPSLRALGWTPQWEAQWTVEDNGLLPYRVVGEERGMWRLGGQSHSPIWGEVTGKWRKEAENRIDLPAVGDWVLAPALESGEERVTLKRILKRRSCLVRQAAGEVPEPQVLAANVDFAFLVTSLNADLNLRRLERYLTLVWDGGATPVILLTKADLVDNAPALMEQVSTVAGEAAVHVINARSGDGLDVVRRILSEGKTGVLLGSSGVGKSTLVNRLLGENRLLTQEIREDDDKGRHTTTSRYLLALPGAGLIIDSPGMREIQLWDQSGGLESLFDDILEIAARCRFTNCQHATEPGCAVRVAIEEGSLERQRLASFQKLERELEEKSTRGRKGPGGKRRR